VRRERAIAGYARYDDFQRWFREYVEMVTQAHPRLLQVKRLNRLLLAVQALIVDPAT
jgi:hypothetical protein